MTGARPSALPSVLVVGGGELGSAVAHRLARSGLRVTVADLERPTCIRREVCFAEALPRGTMVIEGVVGLRTASPALAREITAKGAVAVLGVKAGAGPAEYGQLAADLGADVLVDARMLKRNQGMSSGLAPLVIGLGPGFRAPGDAHAVVETNRGHNLGRVISAGEAEADTGSPGEIGGYSDERVIRAPASGTFGSGAPLGTLVARGEAVGCISGAAGGEAACGETGTPVLAPIDGLLRGLVADGVAVEAGRKIGDVDPRGAAIDIATVSDKGRAVAGGVLEAVMRYWATRGEG